MAIRISFHQVSTLYKEEFQRIHALNHKIIKKGLICVKISQERENNEKFKVRRMKILMNSNDKAKKIPT